MRVQLLSTDGAQYMAFAKQRMQTLSDLRVSLNVPALERTLWIGAVTIYLRATELENLVRISGGGSLPHILLFNGTQVWGFDWATGKLTKQLALTSAGNLDEGWGRGRCALSETGLLTAKKTGVTASRQVMGDVSQHVTTSDALLFADIDGVSLVTATGTAGLLTLPADRTLTDFTQMQGNGYAVTEEKTPQWNATRTIEAVRTSLTAPANSTFEHRWSPRIYYPELGNVAPLPPARGLMYGTLLNGDIPATEIKVTFGGYFEDRCRDTVNGCEANDFRKGYCETLTEMTIAEDGEGNAVTPYVIRSNSCHFIASLWEAPRTTFYSRPALPGVGYKFAGSSHQRDTPASKFSISYQGVIPTAPEVHWWSALGDTYEETVDPLLRYPLHGILAHGGGSWALHTWRGYVTFIAQGTGYIGHSVSTNGEFVAVFTGAEGVITTVTVYNIQKTALVVTKAVAQGFTSGVVVPTKPLNDPVPVPLPEASVPVADESDREMISSLGGFTKLPTGQFEAPAYADGWKVVIDGKNAVASLWKDECWKNATCALIRPTSVDPNFLLTETFSVEIGGKTYSSLGWAGLGGQLPYLLWFAAGEGVHNEAGIATWSGAAVRAGGVNAGTNTVVLLAKRAETLLVGLTDNNANQRQEVSVSSNAVGPVTINVTPEDAVVELEDGSKELVKGAGCEDIRITAIDSCGVGGELVIAAADIKPLSVELASGPPSGGCYGNLPVGDAVLVRGGLAPYKSGIDNATGKPFFLVDGNMVSINFVPPPANNPCTGASGLSLYLFDACGARAELSQCPGGPPGYTLTGPAVQTIGGLYSIALSAELLALSPTITWALETAGTPCGAITANGASATTDGFSGCGCNAVVSAEITMPGATCGASGIVMTPPVPAISGPLTGVVVGSQFSASGGTAPYTWSVSKGGIDAAGIITAIACTPGAAAYATVTVTDACGKTASMVASYASGSWVTIWTKNTGPEPTYYIMLNKNNCGNLQYSHCNGAAYWSDGAHMALCCGPPYNYADNSAYEQSAAVDGIRYILAGWSMRPASPDSDLIFSGKGFNIPYSPISMRGWFGPDADFPCGDLNFAVPVADSMTKQEWQCL